jgi:hypothetical protein
MAQAGINVQLSVKEIYDVVCPKCKEKIRELIRTKVTDQMINQVIGTTEKK